MWQLRVQLVLGAAHTSPESPRGVPLAFEGLARAGAIGAALVVAPPPDKFYSQFRELR